MSAIPNGFTVKVKWNESKAQESCCSAQGSKNTTKSIVSNGIGYCITLAGELVATHIKTKITPWVPEKMTLLVNGIVDIFIRTLSSVGKKKSEGLVEDCFFKVNVSIAESVGMKRSRNILLYGTNHFYKLNLIFFQNFYSKIETCQYKKSMLL